MNDPMPTTATVTVKQRHRDAAADVLRIVGRAETALSVQTGRDDGHATVQAFARFDHERNATLERKNAALREALTPFAEYADPRQKIPASHILTAGSPIAKRQLTMGDCYRARNAFGGQP